MVLEAAGFRVEAELPQSLLPKHRIEPTAAYQGGTAKLEEKAALSHSLHASVRLWLFSIPPSCPGPWLSSI